MTSQRYYCVIDLYFTILSEILRILRYDSLGTDSVFIIDLNATIKVAYTSGQIFEKIMKRYPIFSVEIINYQIVQKHK